MCIDIENITKIINQVTGENLTPKKKWGDNGYRFYDDEKDCSIYITVDEVEDDRLIFTISKFKQDIQLANALSLVYPNARMWVTRNECRYIEHN